MRGTVAELRRVHLPEGAPRASAHAIPAGADIPRFSKRMRSPALILHEEQMAFLSAIMEVHFHALKSRKGIPRDLPCNT